MTGSSERPLDLALRLTAELATNAIVAVARAADWMLEQISSETTSFLSMGGSEWHGVSVENLDGEYDDEGSIRDCPCGRGLLLYVSGDFDEFNDEYVDWRHDDGTRACDDIARELFEIRWTNYPSGMIRAAINESAMTLRKSDPAEYFRLRKIWQDRPKD